MMSAYKIVTDSSCDFTKQQYKDLGLTYAPLYVMYKGETYESFTEPQELKMFYDGIREGEMPTTSAANVEDWTKVMEPVLESGEDVLALCFTSGLSTTYQSAVIAAAELKEKYPQRKINVVDTLCAALGQGLLVWYACQKRDGGMDLDELTAWVEENKLHICHWFTVNDLFLLKRGGRVSATTALVGTMLNIKPIMHMSDEGKLVSVGKVRGRKASIEGIAAKIAELGAGYNNETVFIVHGDCPEEAEQLAQIAKTKYGVKNVMIGYVDGVIGAHTGPGVLSIFFMGVHR